MDKAQLRKRMDEEDYTGPLDIRGQEESGGRTRPIWVRPSTANLWAGVDGCPASATFAPPPKGSEENAHTLRGTRLHAAVASIIAPGPENPRPALEDGEWSVAQRAVAELEAHVDTDAYEWRVETKFGRHMGTEGTQATWLDGTADLVGLAKERGWRGRGVAADEPRMVVADFKMGRQPVEAEGNRQLLAYAVLLLDGQDMWAQTREWADTDTIRLMIVQPANADTGEPVVKKALVSHADVMKEAARLDTLVGELTDASKPVRFNPTAGNCCYCPGARSGKCPEVSRSMVAAEGVLIRQGNDGAEIAPLHPNAYFDFLAKADLVAEMAKHVREDARRRLEREEDIPGLKLVAGRAGNRRWKDAAATAKELLEHGDHGNRVELFTEPVLKSPAQLDKAFKGVSAPVSGGIIARGVERPPATKTVAYEDDPRQALGQTAVAAAVEHFKQANKGD